MNFLLLTADDMNWDATGCFGGPVPDVTPNINRLAAEGMRFDRAHVTAAVCQPSRECLMTGRYPHNNGGMGFEPIRLDVPTLQESLRAAGYLNGILGKVTHLAPQEKFCWDFAHDMGDLTHGRDPAKYGSFAHEFLGRARDEGKPFFLMANAHDPHRPFVGSRQERDRFGDEVADIPPPSRTFSPEEIEVPGFLPDIPAVRQEVAEYYSSCRRCDDTVGAVLQALDQTGFADDTLVMFLSDNGMAFPFSKTNCYLHSTRTPWIARWPGVVDPGHVEEDRFISGIDFTPTILDLAGITPPPDLDGRSFAPLLRGEGQDGRDHVFTVFHETSAKRKYPMRCVQDGRFGYIWNGWSDGEYEFRNESQSGLTFNAMADAAETDPRIAERVHFFQYRALEELYDFQEDPDALYNLIDDPSQSDRVSAMRSMIQDWMVRVDDPDRPLFESQVAAK